MPVTHGVAGSSPVRTAEMPVSRSINRHLSFYILSLQYANLINCGDSVSKSV